MALSLSPETLSSPQVLSSTINLNNSHATFTTLAQMNETKQFANLVGHQKLEEIAAEILLTAEASGETYKHMQWNLEINSTQGVLKVIEVRANLQKTGNNLKIDLTAVFVEVHQAIPPVYSIQEGSYKSGPRRYLVAGPRETVYYKYQVPRGLNSGEIAQVIQALHAKIPEARALIKAA